MTTINFKIDPAKRSMFKEATKNQGTNMQAILGAFVDLYLMNPGRFVLKMEAGNHMFPTSEDASAQNITYMEKDFPRFKIRQTIENGKKKDEYYLKTKGRLDAKKVLEYMKTAFTGCEIDLLDPEKILNLEYDIYVIAKDELIKGIMMDSFESLNVKLGA